MSKETSLEIIAIIWGQDDSLYKDRGNSNGMKWLGSGTIWKVKFMGFHDSFDVKGEVDQIMITFTPCGFFVCLFVCLFVCFLSLLFYFWFCIASINTL